MRPRRRISDLAWCRTNTHLAGAAHVARSPPQNTDEQNQLLVPGVAGEVFSVGLPLLCEPVGPTGLLSFS
ncbi:hypothetical protein OKW28_006710 [Paraburkholderia sp. 40]